MRTECALDSSTVGDLLHHVPRDDVATREFLFVGLKFDHEALEVAIEQVSSVATAALGHEDAARRETRRVELDGFHVSQRYAGAQRDGGSGSFVDGCIGGVLTVDAAVAPGRDDGCVCH
jgi:hypothetical protein